MSSFLVCQLRLLHSRYCSLKTQGNYLQARNGLGGAPWPPTHPFNLFLFPVISLLRSMWQPHHSQRGDFSLPLNICSLHSAAWLKLQFLGVLRFGPNESLPLQLARRGFCTTAESPAQMTSRWLLHQRSTHLRNFFLNELNQVSPVWVSSFIRSCRLTNRNETLPSCVRRNIEHFGSSIWRH